MIISYSQGVILAFHGLPEGACGTTGGQPGRRDPGLLYASAALGRSLSRGPAGAQGAALPSGHTTVTGISEHQESQKNPLKCNCPIVPLTTSSGVKANEVQRCALWPFYSQ